MNRIILNGICNRRFYNDVILFVGMFVGKRHSEKHFVSTLTVINKFFVGRIYIAEFCNNAAGLRMGTFFRNKTEHSDLRV